MALVVLIDADPLQARLITDNLESVGHHVVWAHQVWDALLSIHRLRPDLLVIDSGVPQWNEVLKVLRKMRGLETIPVMLIAARCPTQYELRRLAVTACMDKHFDAQQLVDCVEGILRPVPLNFGFGAMPAAT